MTTIAKEMERQNFTIPLMVGGATTSKVHTAVKIAPEYSGTTVQIKDASLCVAAASKLLSNDKVSYIEEIKASHQKLRELHNTKNQKLIPIDEARKNRLQINRDVPVQKPNKLGVFSVESSIEELIPYIDWAYLLYAWEIKGRFPDVLNDPEKGGVAAQLLADAKEVLEELAKNKSLTIKGVYGIFPANSDMDDIIVYRDENRDVPIGTLCTLRQQMEKDAEHPHMALADFIAPKGSADYIGAFAVTAGLGVEELLDSIKDEQDDFKSIMIKVLADRLAEAFAEKLHADIRKDAWGFGVDEELSNDELLKEAYQGIRPAPGYPACPDHSEKETIFKLLDAESKTGIKLTESKMMDPAASVSGLIFANKEARYFTVGHIGDDQLSDYSKRKSESIENIKQWIGQ
jgi:5-methyltetrahydrofolate--homocysteine methyltransferase